MWPIIGIAGALGMVCGAIFMFSRPIPRIPHRGQFFINLGLTYVFVALADAAPAIHEGVLARLLPAALLGVAGGVLISAGKKARAEGCGLGPSK